jgi:hypothetical protein
MRAGVAFLAGSGASALNQIAIGGGGELPNSFAWPCAGTAALFLNSKSLDPEFTTGKVDSTFTI